MALLFAGAGRVYAGALAEASLDLNSFSITPNSGSILYGPWSLYASATALNSDGGFSISSSSASAASVSASASVPFATGNASGSYPALTAHVDATVNVPVGNHSAAVFPAVTELDATITLTGTSGSVPVTFAASLDSFLHSVTTLTGVVLRNDTIFTLNVNGSPVLSFNDQLPAGPGTSAQSSMSPSLSNLMNLDNGTTYNLSLTLETDPQVSNVPDTGVSSMSLLIGGAGLVIAWRKAGTRRVA